MKVYFHSQFQRKLYDQFAAQSKPTYIDTAILIDVQAKHLNSRSRI